MDTPTPSEKTDKTEEVKTKKEDTQVTYSVKIDMGTAVVFGEGASFDEALASMERPIKVLGTSAVTISDGTREKTLLFPPIRTKRLFYPISRAYMARQLQLLFK